MSKSVVLDGQVLHGVDDYGQWQVNETDGWAQAPPEKSNSEARPLADGDYDAVVRYGPRLVTLNGRLIARNPMQAFLAREMLSSLLQAPGIFQVEEFGFIRWGMARRGQIRPGKIKGRFLTFTMELRFINPYKFGAEYTKAGSSTSAALLFHRGTAPAWPVVTVSGSNPAGYALTLNGNQVTVGQPLVTGTPHTLDYRTGVLRIGSAIYRGGLGAANFSPIRPGLPQEMSISAGSVTAAYQDTFI
jgi:hypothetical protein